MNSSSSISLSLLSLVNHLTRSLAITCAPWNITVNALAPGFFPSKMTAFGMKNDKEGMNHVQPLGRIGSSQDMAGVVGVCVDVCVYERHGTHSIDLLFF